MGNGIAHVAALSGYRVNLIDLNKDALDSAINKINDNLDRQIQKDKITSSEKIEAMGNIALSIDINDCRNSDLVIEAVPEVLSLKTKLFSEIDSFIKKDAILASNTSSISISDLAGSTNRADRVIGMHFMNPVPIMKLVEVIKGKLTSNETTNKIIDLSKRLNKIPVLVNDAPGFVANRILMPMINEAIETLNQKVSGVEEIDTVMILGMSHPMGPLHLADFIGLDVCLSILNVMYDGFKNQKYKPNELLEKMVKEGDLGIKSGKGFYAYKGKEKAVSSRFKN